MKIEFWMKIEFSNASYLAIGPAAYLRTISEHDQCEVGFVLGQSKLAPLSEPTILQLELSGAVRDSWDSTACPGRIGLQSNAVKFYCDSKVILGYISNDTKHLLYICVYHRVQRIRQTASAEQCHYVSSEHNPADLAIRSVPANRMMNIMWFWGPSFCSSILNLRYMNPSS